MKKWKWYVYIVECLDNTYYTGMTWNSDIRSDQHLTGKGSKYTAKHGFKKIVYSQEFSDINEARTLEIKIKNWSQEKKRKLISGEWK